MTEKVTFALLPKAGLGNKLYVWAKAAIFAKINHTILITWGWTQLSLGPFFRKEKSKRLYLMQFKIQIFDLLTLLKIRGFKNHVIDPPLIKFDEQSFESTAYCFKGVKKGIPDDSFREIKPFQNYIKVELQKMLTKDVKEALSGAESPIVGIHIRRGDFAFTPWLTPLVYFNKRINQIREVSGKCLPVTIFSDGTDEDLASLLDMPEVRRASTNFEIVDILLLSRSQVLVTCPASTFSNWSAFLSDGIIVRDYLFPHKNARPQKINKIFFEGIPGDDINDWPDLLVQNLRNVKYYYK